MTVTHLSVFKLNIQEVKVFEDSELLLGGGVVHVLELAGSLIRGHQAGLVLYQVQFSTTREDNLQRKALVIFTYIIRKSTQKC